MKNLFYLLILLTSLSANKIYINLGTVKYKSSLSSVNFKLNNLGYKLYIQKYKNLYIAYTGPFKNQNYAKKALVVIRSRISRNASISIQYSSKKKIKINKKIHNKKTHNKFFIGLIAGLSKLNIDEKSIEGNLPLDIQLRNTGISYGIEAGYYFNKNIFMTLNYQYTVLENIYFDSIFTTLNYKFTKLYQISPYLGLLAGSNTINWKHYPINSIESIKKASSFIGGIQCGIEIPIIDDIDIYIFYRYLTMKHITKISTLSAEKELRYDSDQNINIGIKYTF